MSTTRRKPAERPYRERDLTSRQRQIQRVYRDSMRRQGRPPSLREIGRAVGLASASSVSYQLSELEKMGLVPDIQEPTYFPVLSRIRAGGLSAPAEEDQGIEDYFPLPRQLVGGGARFLLTVVGDSMIDAGIFDGDWIVIRQQEDAQDSEIVAAMIEGAAGWEATVKTYKKKDGHIWLMPQNPAYEPIPGDDATILGRVVAGASSPLKLPAIE
jgi:repressor LexA